MAIKAIISTIAAKHSLDPVLAQAFLNVESNGAGFFTDWDGKRRIKIQFEPHIFRRELPASILKAITAEWDILEKQGRQALTAAQVTRLNNWKKAILNKVELQREEWAAFNAAYAIHPGAAMKSCSWGASQIMGFNHGLIGYTTVGAMVDAFKESEDRQIEGFFAFCASVPGMLGCFRRKDFAGMALRYNGKGYKKFSYDTRIRDEYVRLGGKI